MRKNRDSPARGEKLLLSWDASKTEKIIYTNRRKFRDCGTSQCPIKPLSTPGKHVKFKEANSKEVLRISASFATAIPRSMQKSISVRQPGKARLRKTLKLQRLKKTRNGNVVDRRISSRVKSMTVQEGSLVKGNFM